MITITQTAQQTIINQRKLSESCQKKNLNVTITVLVKQIKFLTAHGDIIPLWYSPFVKVYNGRWGTKKNIIW